MPRAKVSPLARRRVAQACNSCKKRKERCDGQAPCGNCKAHRRDETCQFTTTASVTTSHHPSPAGSAPLLREAADYSHDPGRHYDIETFLDRSIEDYTQTEEPKRGDPSLLPSTRMLSHSRMLRDGKGKFIYVGDSASLSFLQTIRHAVAASIGPCEFTTDHLRHLMIETTPSMRFDMHLEPRPSVGLSLALAEQYIVAVAGVLDLFDYAALLEQLPAWVEDPNRRERPNCPIIYLSLALGAQARAQDEMDESVAEHYFGYGRHLAITTLMDDPSLLTVQAFALITYYMIAACRRNGAFMNLGIAVRAAYALGIHRHETNVAFVREEGISRERAWKSLRTCDLFLSESMGRPAATSEANCNIPWASVECSPSREQSTVTAQVASAIFRICLVHERILTEVYARGAVTLELAGSISKQHREWTTVLPEMLKIDGLYRNDEGDKTTMSRRLGSRIVIMAYYYSIILLTRPFLTFRVCYHPKSAGAAEAEGASHTPNVTTYADACVDAAIRGITVAHEIVYDENMPKRAPLIINSVFASALSLGLAYLGDYDLRGWPLGRHLDRAIAIFRHFGALNPQSARYAQICSFLADAAARYVGKRDEALLRSSSELVRNVFGDVRNSSETGPKGQPETRLPKATSSPPPPPPTSGNVHAQAPTASPYSVDYSSILQESMITTSGMLAMHPEQYGGYPYADPYDPSMQDFFVAHAASVSSDFSFGEDVPLFSMLPDLAPGAYDHIRTAAVV